MRKLLLCLLLAASICCSAQVSVIRARTYPYSTSLGYVGISYDSSGRILTFKLPVSSLAGAGGGFTPSGTTLQYVKGDGSYGTFPTNLSSFTNGPGYLTTTTGDARYLQSFTESDPVWAAAISSYYTKTAADARYAGLSHTHAISDVTGLQTALNGKQATITTGTTLQYLRGDLSLATFPTAVSTFFNDAGYLVAASITGKLNISDTAAMLLNYRTSMNASAAAVLLKLNISDTAGMLNAYRNQMNVNTLAISNKQAQLSGTGFVKASGTTISYDNSTYLTANQSITWTASTDISGSASGATAISPALTVVGIRGVTVPALSTGFLKYNGSAWTYDASTYLTANQSISFTPGAGDVTGSSSGATSLTPTLTIGSNVVTYAKFQQVAASSLVGNPTGSGATAQGITLAGNLGFSGTTLTTFDKENSLLANATSTVVTSANSNLSFSAAANEVWVIEFNWTAQCSSTGGSKFQITAPTGATVEGWYLSSGAAITTLVYQRITAINTLTGTATHTVATTPAPDRIWVRVKVSSTAGTIALGFASVTATQTTTIFAGASMIARKVTEL